MLKIQRDTIVPVFDVQPGYIGRLRARTNTRGGTTCKQWATPSQTVFDPNCIHLASESIGEASKPLKRDCLVCDITGKKL